MGKREIGRVGVGRTPVYLIKPLKWEALDAPDGMEWSQGVGSMEKNSKIFSKRMRRALYGHVLA